MYVPVEHPGVAKLIQRLIGEDGWKENLGGILKGIFQV
jgi:hypothetical protein